MSEVRSISFQAAHCYSSWCSATACRIIVINAARLLKYPRHSAGSRSLTRTINGEYDREKTAAGVDPWTIFETSLDSGPFIAEYHSFGERASKDDATVSD